MSVLIVGFGNPLAGDDAVGWRAAELLASSLEAPGVRVMPCRQLTPELAAEVAEATLVIFVDAGVEIPPGKIACRRVKAVGGSTPFSHHFSPERLLALVEQLYGRRPEAVLFSVGARSFAGSHLSSEVEQALPVLLGEVRELVARITQVGKPDHQSARPAEPEDFFSVMH